MALVTTNLSCTGTGTATKTATPNKNQSTTGTGSTAIVRQVNRSLTVVAVSVSRKVVSLFRTMPLAVGLGVAGVVKGPIRLLKATSTLFATLLNDRLGAGAFTVVNATRKFVINDSRKFAIMALRKYTTRVIGN